MNAGSRVRIVAACIGALCATVPVSVPAQVQWHFNWYCSGCGAIGARTTGTNGPFSSRDACESARSSMQSTMNSRGGGVHTVACQSSGVDIPRSQPSISGSRPSPVDRGGYPVQPSPSSVDNDQRRAEEERLRREQDERQRLEAERQRAEAFAKSRDEALRGLKSLGQSGDLNVRGIDSGSDLGLKDLPSLPSGSAAAAGAERLKAPGGDRGAEPGKGPQVAAPAEALRDVLTIHPEATRKKWSAAVRKPALRQQLKDAYDLYDKGYTEQADIKSRALLEKARAEALTDLRKDIQRQKRQIDQIGLSDRDVESLFELPTVRRLTANELMRRVQERIRDKQLGVDLPPGEDLSFLFDLADARPAANGQTRQWPGPRNPNAPLPNPLAEEQKLRAAQRIIYQRNRENKLVEYMVGATALWGEMLQIEAEERPRR